MTNSHTPGPWTYSVGTCPDPFISDELDPAYFAINGQGHREFASVVRLRDTGEVHSNGEANARLIAAAPDLLAACEAAPIIRMDDTIESFKERYSKWYRESRHAAIAKAKGVA